MYEQGDMCRSESYTNPILTLKLPSFEVLTSAGSICSQLHMLNLQQDRGQDSDADRCSLHWGSPVEHSGSFDSCYSSSKHPYNI